MIDAFQPIPLGNISLPNRFIMGSMHLGMEGSENSGNKMASFYAKRFEGGVGLIVTGGIGVNEEGRGSNGFFNIQKEEHFQELKAMNDSLKGKGVMCAQLFHAGRYAYFRECVAPSAIRAPINRFVPRALTEEECWSTIKDFGKSAILAKECGFGAVEIMGSEGYLLNQFFSPVTNKREDFFGGNHEKRMNFSIETLKEVKRNLPEGFPIIFRMSGIDLIPGNPNFEEVCQLAEALRDNGVTALNIGIGWHESRIPTISQLVPRGAWAKIAAKIKNKVKGVPIIASNRVNSPETIEAIFQNEEADIISMARPFLADASIINKIKEGKQNRVNTCIACNQACLDHAFIDETVSCIVNPEAGHELSYAKFFEEKTPIRNVVVVGSGPGGLEAARAASKKGHKVTLIEKDSRLGGQLNMAANIPGKSEFYETIRYFENELPAIGVEIRLNTNCTEELLNSLNPDAVIFATGVKPRDFTLPGIEQLKCGTYVDYLKGNFTPGEKVAVIGGGGIGVDVAHKLTEEKEASIDNYFHRYNVLSYTEAGIQKETPKKKVAVFKRSGKPGAGLGPTTFWALRQELESNGVEFHFGLQYKDVQKDGLRVVTNKKDEYTFECDSIILCV
ncbi:MAG: FAD-dependent oxidoreductase, partial [Leptospiraceae bacterium]|nr:FAD-dependent oxidoreductase [Leptospiraceae bacterium]